MLIWCLGQVFICIQKISGFSKLLPLFYSFRDKFSVWISLEYNRVKIAKFI